MNRWSRGGDFDLAGRSELISIVGLCGAVGLIFGGMVGWGVFGWHPVSGALVIGLPMGIFMSALAYYMVALAGQASRGLHNPSGDGTPRRYGLSREEGLIVAGRAEDAAVALSEAYDRYPDDPRPATMLAELYRDQLDDLEQAAAWYRRAAAVPDIGRDTERQILRALVELCRDRIGRPELAAPALSRAARLHAGDRLGYWASQELRLIKQAMNVGSAKPR